MGPQSVIAVESPQQEGGSWPRLLRILSIMILLFCLAETAGAAQLIYLMLRPRSFPTSPRFESYQRLQLILSFAIGVVDLVVAAGAVNIWRRNRGHRLVRICIWIWLALLIGQALEYLQMMGPGEFLANFALHSLVTATFPVLMLLILREYSREQIKS